MPLSALENSLQAWLREQLPLPEDVGDVSFDSPDGIWGTSVTRPTVNLFLFEIARAAQQPVAMAARRDVGGTLMRDQPAPAVSFSYLLSTWGGGVREEHRLLGDAVRAVLRTPFLVGDPAQTDLARTDLAQGGLVGPIHLALATPEQVRARDLWGALGGRLRASLVLVATTAVTLERPQPVAVSVDRVEVAVRRGARARNGTRKLNGSPKPGGSQKPVGPPKQAVPQKPLRAEQIPPEETRPGEIPLQAVRQLETPQDGTAQNGTAQNGTAQNGTAQDEAVSAPSVSRRFVWFGRSRQRQRGRD